MTEHVEQLRRITELRRELGLPQRFRGKTFLGWSTRYYRTGRLRRWIRRLERQVALRGDAVDPQDADAQMSLFG